MQNRVWEERWHPLREEWVIVAAHRQNRPWQGENVQTEEKVVPRYLEDCYLCPGNSRISGARNPNYGGIFVFDNDHPCVGMDAPAELISPSGIYRNRPARGIARVVCYTPRHDLSLAELSPVEIENLLGVWQSQYTELTDLAQVLKNRLVRFDNLWRMPFPYVMPLHQAPTGGGDYRSFHFHIEFHPPLRKPNLPKYLDGPEIGGGNFLSDTSPEEKAAELRAVSDVHYKTAPE